MSARPGRAHASRPPARRRRQVTPADRAATDAAFARAAGDAERDALALALEEEFCQADWEALELAEAEDRAEAG